MSKPEKVLPLTSLRFFAALGIVFHHYFEASFPVLKHNRWVSPIVDYSAVGVFFFVLSGYIIGYVYFSSGENPDRRKFWISRFARIYPLYIVTIIACIPHLLMARIAHFGLKKALMGTTATFVVHALLLQHWIPQLGTLNYPSWSISAEAFFYLFFPWLGIFLWRRSTRRAVTIGALWFVLSWTIAWIGGVWARFNVVHYAMPLFEINLFVIGIVLAKVHAGLQQSPRGSRWLIRNGGMLAAGSIAALFMFTEWKPLVPFSHVHDAFAGILFVVLILGFASGNLLVQRLFTNRWLVVLGESSYGLYLIHAALYEWLMILHFRPGHSFFVVYLLGAIVLSVLSFYYFETPARRAILRYYSTRSRESTAEAAIAQ